MLQSTRTRHALLVGALLAAVAAAACKHPTTTASADAPGPADAATDSGPVQVEQLAPSTAEAGAIPSLRIAALDAITPISNRPEWPPKDPTKASDERMGVVRLGYLRKGDQVDAKTTILKKGGAPRGGTNS